MKTKPIQENPHLFTSRNIQNIIHVIKLINVIQFFILLFSLSSV
jgi:hypothetical protein